MLFSNQRMSIKDANKNLQPRETKIKYEIQIKKLESLESIPYYKSLNLETSFVKKIEKKRNKLGLYLYFFEISVKNDQGKIYSWKIKRRLNDFITLIKSFRKENITLNNFDHEFHHEKESEKNLENFTILLQNFAQNNEIREKSIQFYDFLEISSLPLDGPTKFKEGYLAKRTGGRFKENICQIYCGVFCKRWLQRWFIVTQEGIIYSINSESTQLREMLLFDQSFHLSYGRQATGTNKGLTIITSNRKLILKAQHFFQALDWISAISEATMKCPYIQTNRYFSFAPIREKNEAKWFIDGEDYMKDLYESLLHSKQQVFITDWWLSPELHLVRPVRNIEAETGLDNVLKTIASNGVKIYVIVYSEVKMALYNDSLYTKKALESLHPNIKVIRHPKDMLFLWSHHEKMVVIDQVVGYLGGIDLCYGRFDNKNHHLTEPNNNDEFYFPGIEFNNARVEDFKDVRNYTICTIDKKTTPRMPWHDIGVKLIGEAVRDLTRHFIQYWNFACMDLDREKNKDFLAPKHRHHEEAEEKIISTKVSPLKKFKNQVIKLLHLDKKIPALKKDNQSQSENKLIATFNEYFDHKVNKNQQDRYESPVIIGKNRDDSVADEKPNLDQIVLKLNEEFPNNEKRINFEPKDIIINNVDSHQNSNTDGKHRKFNDNLKNELILTEKNRSETKKKYSFDLTEKDFENLKNNAIHNEKKLMKKESRFKTPESPKAKEQKHKSLWGKVLNEEFFLKNMLQIENISKSEKQGSVRCQLIRSAAQWSLGLNEEDNIIENSIQNAYIESIQNSEHFIYIENQFFISSTAGEPVNNEIARAILLRILKAHKKNEKFFVIIFLPLLPGFAGDVGDPKSTVLRVQIHWQYQTISRGEHSIFAELRKKGINPDDYLRFYSLRNHTSIKGLPLTEIIYIHSKLMIIDDNVVIIGSANINDRSMQGSRDSEIAVVIEDTKKIKARFAGQEFLISEFAHSLRVSLMNEHTSLSFEELSDPIALETLSKIHEIAN